MHILPNATSICASVTKETYQPQHKIITTDPYAKKKINKQNIRYLKFDSTWFLGINYFMLKAEKGGGDIVLGYFWEKKIPCLLKKYFIPLSVQEFVFEVWIAPFCLMSLSAWLIFLSIWCVEKKIYIQTMKKKFCPAKKSQPTKYN